MPEPFLTVAMRTGDLTFGNVEQVEGLLQREQEAWKWAMDDTTTDTKTLRNRISARLTAVRNTLEAHKAQPSEGTKDDLKNALSAAFTDAKERIPLSDTAEGQYVACIKDGQGVGVAAMTAAALIGAIDDHRAMGVANAQLFTHGVVAQGHVRSLDETSTKWKTMHEAARSSYDALVQRITDKQTYLEETATGLIKEKTKLFEELEHRYRKIKELEEPAGYWSAKTDYHRKRAVWWGIAAAFAAVVLGGGLLLYASFVRERFLYIANPTVWHVVPMLAPSAVIAIGLFWLLRILVRAHLSHSHLQMDADERVVMAKTYLALCEGKRPLGDKDMEIVLVQMFRHAPDGVVKDDAAPPLIIKSLTEK